MNSNPEPPHFDVFGLTDVGHKREENEDQFLIASLHKQLEPLHSSLDREWLTYRFRAGDAYLFVVADGLGGLAKGREASSVAVETLAERITHAASCFYMSDVDSEHEFLEKLEQAMERAHERIKEMQERGGRAAATTLTMITLLWPRGYIVHVGDSRGYYLRKGRLRQFTRDQTMADFMVDMGRLTEEQATKSGLDHVLLSALGAEDAMPTVGLVDLEPGDVLLLCTDGLTGYVSDERIQELLETSDDAETNCHRLVDEALAAGGHDNVTVVVVRMKSR